MLIERADQSYMRLRPFDVRDDVLKQQLWAVQICLVAGRGRRPARIRSLIAPTSVGDRGHHRREAFPWRRADAATASLERCRQRSPTDWARECIDAKRWQSSAVSDDKRTPKRSDQEFGISGKRPAFWRRRGSPLDSCRATIVVPANTSSTCSASTCSQPRRTSQIQTVRPLQGSPQMAPGEAIRQRLRQHQPDLSLLAPRATAIVPRTPPPDRRCGGLRQDSS